MIYCDPESLLLFRESVYNVWIELKQVFIECTCPRHWSCSHSGLTNQFNSIQFNSIQTVYFPEGAYNSNMAMDQRGRTMPKPFMSNNDILSMFQLRTSTGLFMSTLVISITNVDEIKTEKHITHKQSSE